MPNPLTMPIGEFLDLCKARGWHFTRTWTLKRLNDLPAELLQPRRCVTCTHLKTFELTGEIWNCPVLNIRLHQVNIDDFGCTFWEAK